jgi:hypothetical protein
MTYMFRRTYNQTQARWELGLLDPDLWVPASPGETMAYGLAVGGYVLHDTNGRVVDLAGIDDLVFLITGVE